MAIEIPAEGWLEIIAPVTQAQLDEYIGPDCPSFDADCPTCVAHAMYRKDGRVPLLVDAEEFIAWAVN